MSEPISKVAPSPGLVNPGSGQVPKRPDPAGYVSPVSPSTQEYSTATRRDPGGVSGGTRKLPDFRNGPNGPMHRHDGSPSYRQWHPVSRKHRDIQGKDVTQKVHLANGCGKDGMGGDAASREASQADKMPQGEALGGPLGLVQKLSGMGVGNISSNLIDAFTDIGNILTRAMSDPMSAFASIASGAILTQMDGFTRRLEERARRSEANFMANPGAAMGTVSGKTELEINSGMVDAASEVNGRISSAIGVTIGAGEEYDISKLGKNDIANLRSSIEIGLKEARDKLAEDASGERMSARDFAKYTEMAKEYEEIGKHMDAREKQIAADERQVSRNIKEENRRKAEFEREEKKRQKQAEEASKALAFKEGSFVPGAAGWKGYGTLADKTFSEFGGLTDDHGIPDSVKGISVASTRLSEHLMRVRAMPETTAEESEYKRRNETALVNALRAIEVKDGYLRTKRDLQRNGYDCNSPQARALSDAYDRAIKEFEFKGVEFDDRGVAVSGNDDIRDAGSSYGAAGSAYEAYADIKRSCDDLVTRMGGHAQGPAGLVKEADEVFEDYASQAAEDIRQSIGATGRLDANSLPSTEKGVRKYIFENDGRVLEMAKILSDIDAKITAGDDAEVRRLIEVAKERELIKNMDYSYNTPAERDAIVAALVERNRGAMIGMKMAHAKLDMIHANREIEKDGKLTRERKDELKAKVAKNYFDRIKDASIGSYEMQRDGRGRVMRDPVSNKPIVKVEPPADLTMSDDDYEAILKGDELKGYYPNEDTKARRNLDAAQLKGVMDEYWAKHEAEEMLHRYKKYTLESDGMPGSMSRLKAMREECSAIIMNLDNKEAYGEDDDDDIEYEYSRRRMETAVLATKCSAKIMRREAYDRMSRYVKNSKPQAVYSYVDDSGETVYTTKEKHLDSSGEEVDNAEYGRSPMYVMSDGSSRIPTDDDGNPLAFESREELGAELMTRFNSNVSDINDTIQNGLTIPRMDDDPDHYVRDDSTGDIIGVRQSGELVDGGIFTKNEGYEALIQYRDGVLAFSKLIGSPTFDVMLDYASNTKAPAVTPGGRTPAAAPASPKRFGATVTRNPDGTLRYIIKSASVSQYVEAIEFILGRARALGGLSERFGVPVGRNAQTAIRKCAKSYLSEVDAAVDAGRMAAADRTSDEDYARMLGYLRATALCAAVEPSKRV